MNEEQILSEYFDGELTPDLQKRVEYRLQHDIEFARRFDQFKKIHSLLHTTVSKSDEEVRITDMQAHVWQKLQRNMLPRRSRSKAVLAAFGDVLTRRIALPIPALAAVAMVFVALGVVVVGRSGGTGDSSVPAISFETSQNLKSAESASQASMALPAWSGASAAPAGFGNDLTRLAPSTQNGLAVTIEVNNLRELLTILEDSKGIHEVTIQMPHLQAIEPVGEATLLRASDLVPVQPSTSPASGEGKH